MAYKARAMSGTAVRCTVNDALSVLAALRDDADIISGFLWNKPVRPLRTSLAVLR